VSVGLRILLVEDNDVYRSSLEAVLGLQQGLEVVGGVGNGDLAAAACRDLEADVVLMDVRLPGLDGVAATAAVREGCPGAAVVCLTAEATPAEREAALAAGAAALVEKGRPVDELVAAVRDAAAGRGSA
jgi:two-component system response regulator DesR